MQAFTWTSSSSTNDLPSPENAGSWQPDPTIHNGYHSLQKRTSNKGKNYKSCCLGNKYSISSASQPRLRPANLQPIQTPKLWFYSNSASFRTACPNYAVQNVPLPSGQPGTHVENLSHHPQSSHVSSLAIVPSLQTLQETYKNTTAMQTSAAGCFPSVSSNGSTAFKDNNLRYVSKPPLFQSLNVQHNLMQTPYQPAGHHQQTAPSVQISEAAKTMNKHQGQMRTVGNGASYSSYTQSSTALQGFTAPSVPPHYRTQQGSFSRGQSQSIVNQVQSSSPFYSQPVPLSAQNSHVSPSQTKYTSNTGPSSSLPLYLPPPYQSIHNVIQSLSTHMTNQNSSLSLSQEKIPSQVHFFGDLLEEVQSRQNMQQHHNISVSGHHSKSICPAFPVNQYNTGPHVQQSNSLTSGLTRTSQNTTSCITPTSVSKDGRQVPGKRHNISPLCLSSNNFESQVSGNKGEHLQAAQGQTAGQGVANSQMQTSVLQYGIPATPCNGEMQKINEHQACDKATVVSVEHDHGHGIHLEAPDAKTRCERAQFSRFQKTQKKMSNGQMGEERQGEVQYCMDPADCIEVIMALPKVVRQHNRAVAVVLPISQQATSPVENITQSTDDCQSLKIDSIWSLVKESEDVEMMLNSPSQPTKKTKDQVQVPSVPLPKVIKECVKPGNGSTVNIPSREVISSENESTLGSQSADIPQSENVPISTPQSSNMSQNHTKAPMCSPGVPAKWTIQQNDDENIGSHLNDSFDLAKAPLFDFTLEKLKDLVKSLELTQVEGEKEKEATDVSKCILDLYWGGDEQNIKEKVKEALATGLLKTSSEADEKKYHTVVFQYLDLEILKMSNRYHILENETSLPTEEFKSSLSSDGQLADIDSVLAEPITDYDFTWCKDISHSLLGSTVNHEDSLVQVNADDPENTAVTIHKDISDTTSKTVSKKSIILDMCHSEPDSEALIPAVTDCQNNAMTLNNALSNLPVCEGKSPSETSKKQDMSEKQEENQQLRRQVNRVVHLTRPTEIPCMLTESNNRSQHDNKDHKIVGEDPLSPSGIVKSKANDITEQQARKDCQAHAELSVSTSDQHVKNGSNDKDQCDRKEISDDANSSCDSILMEVTLLSFDDTKMIFKEYSYSNQPSDSPQSCQDDPKNSVMSPIEPNHVTSKKELVSSRSHSHIRFTCPHVTYVACDDDHFCPKCWAKTPLLDIDLDEVEFTPKEDEPSITEFPSKPDNQRQNSGPQYGKQVKEPVVPICLDSDSIAISDLLHKCDGSDMTAFPKPDGRQNYTPVYDEPQYLELLQPICLTSGSITKTVADKMCDVRASPRAESPKGLSDIGTTAIADLRTPKYDGSDSTTAYSKPDEKQSYNSISDEYQVQKSIQPLCPSSVLIKSAADEIYEVMTFPESQSYNTLSDMGNIENVKPVFPSQTINLRRKGSPSRHPPHKKLKHTHTPLPADDLFAPDIVVNNPQKAHEHKTGIQLCTYPCDGQNSIVKKEIRNGGKKQSGKEKHSLVKITNPSNQHPIPTELDANRIYRKRQNEVPNVCKTVQSWNAVSEEKKGPACSVLTMSNKSQHNSPNDTKETKQEDVKISLVLYGPKSNSSDDKFVHRCHDRDKISAAPAYVTISSSSATSKTYTDKLTARQKVYNNWCSTFVKINNTSLRRKCHKQLKNKLKIRMKAMTENN